MAQQIPVTPSVPIQTFNCDLAGTQYQFRARWNTRESAWYIDVAQDDGTPIRHGMKAVLNAALGRRSTDASFPRGFIYACDTSGANVEAGLDDFGLDARVQLVFFTFTDMGFEEPA